MYRLEYINENGNKGWELIANFRTEKDMNKNISDFLKKHNFKSYYSRQWVCENGYTMIDFGSHSQFYRFKKFDEFGRKIGV